MGSARGQAAECPLPGQVLQHVPQLWTGGYAKAGAQVIAIEWRARMEQGIARVAPADEGGTGDPGGLSQDKGGQILLHVSVQV